MITNLGTARHVARKVHECDSCGRRINPREPYFKSPIVNGSVAWTWKEHTSCHRASEIAYLHGIEGHDGYWLNVCDFEDEDRAIILHEAPEVWQAIWGGCRDAKQEATP
jgi:hypothetical protein